LACAPFSFPFPRFPLPSTPLPLSLKRALLSYSPPQLKGALTHLPTFWSSWERFLSCQYIVYISKSRTSTCSFARSLSYDGAFWHFFRYLHLFPPILAFRCLLCGWRPTETANIVRRPPFVFFIVRNALVMGSLPFYFHQNSPSGRLPFFSPFFFYRPTLTVTT